MASERSRRSIKHVCFAWDSEDETEEMEEIVEDGDYEERKPEKKKKHRPKVAGEDRTRQQKKTDLRSDTRRSVRRTLKFDDQSWEDSNAEARESKRMCLSATVMSASSSDESADESTVEGRSRRRRFRSVQSILEETYQDSIVLYQDNGVMVPFDSRLEEPKPRPQVELDEETLRIWKLLQGCSDSEGVNGTDEEKAKRWENERELYHSRIKAFIAYMRQVQGDSRRFTPWKGSVLDSIVGVFLTQSVFDHVSSSAFMSIAAKYPPKSGNTLEDDINPSSFSSFSSGTDWDIEEDPNRPVSFVELLWQQIVNAIPTTNEAPNSFVELLNQQIQKGKEVSTANQSSGESACTDEGADTSENSKNEKATTDWDKLRKQTEEVHGKRERTPETMDSVDWERVRCANVDEIAETIRERGMHNKLAERIQGFLNRILTDHGSLDLEWLRDAEPNQAKEFLLSIKGLGIKSTECVRLLTLHQVAFPVDTNVGRIAVRLGWVPLQSLPESLQLHLLELYPVLESIQKYLWPRLCKLDQPTLYELHYQMITFGKVFCTKINPNCNACPLKAECKHFASAYASARLALPAPEERSIISATQNESSSETVTEYNYIHMQLLEGSSQIRSLGPIIEEPLTPESVTPDLIESDLEDFENTTGIPEIKLNLEELNQTLQDYVQMYNQVEDSEMSSALVVLDLVVLDAKAASIPMPKLKDKNKLRTEHLVYELPNTHPILQVFEKKEADDPSPYLLAIWTPGETADSINPPESTCRCLQFPEKRCDSETCFSCNSIRESNNNTVRGTILIPIRTAMRGSFPLNGTYFQTNEVLADHETSLNPIAVSRDSLWNLPRQMVYFGTSVTTIFRGLTQDAIRLSFWRGFVCVRGFDKRFRAPRPLVARLHYSESKAEKRKGSGEKYT